MLLDFVPSNPNEPLYSYDKVSYSEVSPMLLYDKIDIAICCNENSSDWDIHEFIVATNGKILDVMMEGMREKTRMNNSVA